MILRSHSPDMISGHIRYGQGKWLHKVKPPHKGAWFYTELDFIKKRRTKKGRLKAVPPMGFPHGVSAKYL